MVNLWGPGAFFCARPSATRPSLTPENGAGDPDDWLKDCTSVEARDGTELRAGLLNALLAQLRGVVRTAGSVPATNLDDLLLAKAMASGHATYAVATGTANDWSVSPALAVPAYAAGRVLNIIAPASNTSRTVNVNISTLGNRRIKKSDGTDPAVGDLVSGKVYATIDDGASIRILTPLPSEISAFFKLNGQCQLTLNGASLLLSPKNGNQVIVNGEARPVPLAGLTLSASGNANNTDYYIYLADNGSGALTLEKSTTAFAIHTDGTAIKSGDPTRALVGLAGSNSSGAWEDSFTNRLVRSYFNRESKRIFNKFTADRSTAATSAAPAEINTEIRVNFVCFADDLVDGFATGYKFSSSGSGTVYSAVTYDGNSLAATTDSGISAVFGTGGGPVAAHQKANLATGRHYATLTGWNSAGTGTWGGNSASAPSCLLHVSLH